MAFSDPIEGNPKVMLGKPVIRGTRIPVELILRKRGEGASEQALLDAYPHLKSKDIRVAMLSAADVLAHEERWHTGGQCRVTADSVFSTDWRFFALTAHASQA